MNRLCEKLKGLFKVTNVKIKGHSLSVVESNELQDAVRTSEDISAVPINAMSALSLSELHDLIPENPECARSFNVQQMDQER